MANLNGGVQDEFDDFMDAQARELRGEWFDGKVAGLTFKNADGTSRQDLARKLNAYDELALERDPENAYDPYAVAVFTPTKMQLGYLEARLAVEVCRVLKRGGEVKCYVRAVRQRGEFCGVSFGLVSTAKKAV